MINGEVKQPSEKDILCIRLKALLEIQMLVFPSNNSYALSFWDKWDQRIRNAHNEDENEINEIYKRFENHKNNYPEYDQAFDQSDTLSDDYWETFSLTNSMYGVLVVAIWSKMESFLKDIILICRDTSEKKDKGSPHIFRKIIKAIKEETKVQIKLCDSYIIINAIRILNNTFKHNDGIYEPKNCKEIENIDKELLDKWKIKEKREIEFSELPIKELITACYSFSRDLIQKVRTELIKQDRL